MGGGWDLCLAEIEKEVMRYADKADSDARQTVRALWKELFAQEVQRRSGGHGEVQGEALLLLALCKLAWPVGQESNCASEDGASFRERALREVWRAFGASEDARSPQEPELGGQPTGKPCDAMPEVPQVGTQETANPVRGVREPGQAEPDVSDALAAVQEVWRSFVDEGAKDGPAARLRSCAGIIAAIRGFPLCDKVPGRMMLLRGAGNAIVPPLAAEFIKAAVEAMDGTALLPA
jgi:hypothetical protein